MKELYTSPVLNVLCFAPVERLAANGVIDFDKLLEAGGNAGEASRDTVGDLDVDL